MSVEDLWQTIDDLRSCEGRAAETARIMRRARERWEGDGHTYAHRLSLRLRNVMRDAKRANNTTSLLTISYELTAAWNEWDARGRPAEEPSAPRPRIDRGGVPGVRKRTRDPLYAPPMCEGGETSGCRHVAVWRVYLPGEPGFRIHACGRHLSWNASYLTDGEQGRLALERIVTDER